METGISWACDFYNRQPTVGFIIPFIFNFVFTSPHPCIILPQMPGVNVPWSQVLYYLVTLTISGVFHEFGHAISAVRYEKVFLCDFFSFM